MKQKIVSIFKDLYKSKDVPFKITLEQALERIKVGKSKDKIESIRNGNKAVKNSLPCILFSGDFSQRNSNSLVEHSGLMVTDFDKYPNESIMLDHLEQLKKTNTL